MVQNISGLQWGKCQSNESKWASNRLTEWVRGSHTRDNYVRSSSYSPRIHRQPRCPGGRHGDERAGRRGAWTPGHSVCTGRWSGARGVPCGCAAGGSRGMTCHTPCTYVASPGASETRAACDGHVSYSLTSPFSTNMAISGQGWRAIPT